MHDGEQRNEGDAERDQSDQHGVARADAVRDPPTQERRTERDELGEQEQDEGRAGAETTGRGHVGDPNVVTIG